MLGIDFRTYDYSRIEISKGSKLKFEYAAQIDSMVLDRVLTIPYPANYGFIPYTLSADGDPIDVFVFSEEPLPLNSFIKHNLVGAIKMLDNGVEDHKLIASIGGAYIDYAAIEEFLRTYKTGTELLTTITSAPEARILLDEAAYNWTRLQQPKWSY